MSQIKRRGKGKNTEKKTSNNGRTNSFFGTSLSNADPEFLRNSLSNYKYVSPNQSLGEMLFLNALWERVVVCYPRWLAPNLITFMGFVAALIAEILLIFLSPHFTGQSPRWWFLSAAVLQWIYQTLDGSDGKQARRTKSGSPLGELFDHGVDALVTSIISTYSIEMYSYGINNMIIMMSFLGVHLSFFYSIFTALHTGKQRFGLFDCQEIQVFVQICLVITAFRGPEIWLTEIPIPTSIVQSIPLWLYDWKLNGANGLESRFIFSVLAVCGCLFSAVSANVAVLNYYRIHGNANAHKEGRGISACLHQQFVIGMQITFFVLSWFTARDLMPSDPSVLGAWFFVYALTFSDIVNHTLLTRVGQLPFPKIWRNRAIIADTIFYVLLHCGTSTWAIYGRWIVVFLIFSSNMHYCITIGNAICDALNIRFFKIPYKKE